MLSQPYIFNHEGLITKNNIGVMRKKYKKLKPWRPETIEKRGVSERP